MPAQSPFTLLDWLIVAGYLALVLAIGFIAAKRRHSGGGSDDYFLAGRSMPVWAVAISILATAQSAATFIGGPQEAYAGNLTYLSLNIGPIIAALIVAFFFIPAFYRHNVTSVYELIGHEMGTSAQKIASAMFMLGRVFASGARLFIVAIPFSLLVFGDLGSSHMALSIVIVTIVATVYSTAGGIRAVIWTDVLQVAVYLICIVLALLLIWQKIPLSIGEVAEALRTAEDGNKLLLFDWSLDAARPYTVWTAAIGFALLMIAAYGADQDLTQRMLTCKTPRRASWSVITATLIGLPVVLLFLVMGLLLHIYYGRPDLMGDMTPMHDVLDSRRIFIDFIVHEMPVGVRGLMIAGLFAAAMSSLDSGLNAMSSTTIADFYRPWRNVKTSKRQGTPHWGTAQHNVKMDADPNAEQQAEQALERRAGRWASLFWAAMIGGFACICIAWYDPDNETLIQFALRVMTFAYAGLLGVFFTAIFTKRGSALSAAAAMAVGFIVVLLFEMANSERWSEMIGRESHWIAFPWRLTIAACASFLVCIAGQRTRAMEPRMNTDAHG